MSWTRKKLLTLGIPAVLIPGILLSITLGWNPKILTKVSDYYAIKQIFPHNGIVFSVVDGDTFTLQNRVEVRMLGVNAPGRGEEGFVEATEWLKTLIEKKQVYLEYDRYQDDKYGRVLAWVWVGCEKNPTFLPADYMHLSYNTSREGLVVNPDGCKGGKLVNEEMVLARQATAERYKERGELKYEKRLSAL